MAKIEQNSRVLLVSLGDNSRRYLVDVARGKFSTRKGDIDLSALVGKDFGCVVSTHLGERFVALRPTLYDFVMKGVRRQTQIVYPKDSGYIALFLGLGNGMRVFECGAGSGAMTVVLANAVAPDGKVVSYEADERFYELSRKNVTAAGMADFVEIYHRDLADGIDGAPYDAMFVDLRHPWEYLEILWQGLDGGAPIAFVLPTANQIIQLLGAIESHGGFVDVQVLEFLMRFYKTVPERLRPEDRMVAHTTFIITARKVVPDGKD